MTIRRRSTQTQLTRTNLHTGINMTDFTNNHTDNTPKQSNVKYIVNYFMFIALIILVAGIIMNFHVAWVLPVVMTYATGYFVLSGSEVLPLPQAVPNPIKTHFIHLTLAGTSIRKGEFMEMVNKGAITNSKEWRLVTPLEHAQYLNQI